jgi:presenilin-like A22 family membrane protease
MHGERLLLRAVLWLAVLCLSVIALWAYAGYAVVEFGAASNDVSMLKENPNWPVSTRPGWVDTLRAASVVGLGFAVVAVVVVTRLAGAADRDTRS